MILKHKYYHKLYTQLADNHSWLSAFLANRVVDYILGKQVAYEKYNYP